MKVCMILEGSYPYVHGGVSSWMHQYIEAMPEVTFILWCICAKAEQKGNYKYVLPQNVEAVHEYALDEALALKLNKKQMKHLKITTEQMEEMKHLFSGEQVDWNPLFVLFHNKQCNPVSLLMSPLFLELLMENCKEKYPYISFGEYFYTVRSMLLPELFLLTQDIPEADIYHATATGYSGLLGSLARWKTGKPFILTEHGIYTREREEELLRATWVVPHFRQQWINLFYTFSHCAYRYADRVTALFRKANDIQEEIGCSRDKLSVISNGIRYERFCNIPQKVEDGYIDIGAVVRIAKIKDVKNMIYAFAELKPSFPKVRLHILGDVDDEEYAQECRQLVDQLQVEDIIFTGVVNVIAYMEKLDFTILTSISEGQPLSVLESMAAGRPCVTTDVGCCKELIYGCEDDQLGDAGIVVPPMYKEKLALAMLQMCRNEKMRKQMGCVGMERVGRYYTHEISIEHYRSLYMEVEDGRNRI